MNEPTRTGGAPVTEATDATLTASRALLGVVARSVADALEQVTLPQFRVLVVLSAEGPLRVSTLAQRMQAVQSTFSRALDRMVAAGWLVRKENPESRREILVHLTHAGQGLVEEVTDRRRAEIERILGHLSPAERETVARGLAAFTRAAGEPAPEDLLILGL